MPSASPTAPAVRTGNGTLTDTPAPNPARQLRKDHFCILFSRLQSASQPEDSGAHGPPCDSRAALHPAAGPGPTSMVSRQSPGLCILPGAGPATPGALWPSALLFSRPKLCPQHRSPSSAQSGLLGPGPRRSHAPQLGTDGEPSKCPPGVRPHGPQYSQQPPAPSR